MISSVTTTYQSSNLADLSNCMACNRTAFNYEKNPYLIVSPKRLQPDKYNTFQLKKLKELFLSENWSLFNGIIKTVCVYGHWLKIKALLARVTNFEKREF